MLVELKDAIKKDEKDTENRHLGEITVIKNEIKILSGQIEKTRIRERSKLQVVDLISLVTFCNDLFQLFLLFMIPSITTVGCFVFCMNQHLAFKPSPEGSCIFGPPVGPQHHCL